MDRLYALLSPYRDLAVWISVGSVAMFLGSLLLVPWLVARAPRDYFVREQSARERGPLALLGAILRNLLGLALLVLGLLMLVLPGQGLLMVLLSLSLLDVPGKRKWVRAIVRHPPVWRALTYLRERAQAAPFEQP